MSVNAEELAPIIDVDAQNFQTDVLDASHDTAILVDFWAEWCAPCKALGPVLEKIVTASNGNVRLAKIDIDSNQEFAGQNGIRSIPTVRLFVDGLAIGEFMGAQPEQAVVAFLEQHLSNTMADNSSATAEAQQAIEAMLRADQFQQAEQALQQLSDAERDAPAMQGVAARVRLGTRAKELPGIDDLLARIAANPKDLDSYLALGTRHAIRADYDKAMENLLLILARDRNFADGGARETVLTLFEALGAEDDRVSRFRGMLANVLN